MKSDLRGKTVLITGGSSGIGRALAVSLTKIGSRVIAVYRTSTHMKETRDIAPEVEFIRGDLKDPHDVRRIFEGVFEKTDKLNGFVHCAGEIFTEPFETFRTRELREMISVNIEAGFLLLRDVLPLFKDGGSIVFVSSIDAYLAEETLSAGYAVTKGALLSLTRALAFELGEKNIRVNAVVPGLIQTGMTEDFFKEEFKNSLNSFLKRVPLNRAGTPEEVANLIMFLLSDDSSYITGSEIFIDGGYHTS